MKQLQNNFTAPEQSKHLLELGLPADSADLYYLELGLGDYSDKPYIVKGYFVNHNDDLLPCWSVGRLIEIHETCTSCLFERRFPQFSVLEDVLAQIAEDIIATDECWDFSKLEE